MTTDDQLIERQRRLVARRRLFAERCDECFLQALEELLEVDWALFSYVPGASFADTVRRDTLRGVPELLRFEVRELGRSEMILNQMLDEYGDNQ